MEDDKKEIARLNFIINDKEAALQIWKMIAESNKLNYFMIGGSLGITATFLVETLINYLVRR
jgi:hypothetical protein